MSEPRTDRDATQESAGRPTEPIRYPTNHIAAIVDTPEQLGGAIEALAGSGVGESQLRVLCGPAEAERLDSTTGRSGLLDLVLRFTERIGLPDDELAVKERYEQALRDSQFVVLVAAPTAELKERAARILREHGGHFINFLGRFTREAIHP